MTVAVDGSHGGPLGFRSGDTGESLGLRNKRELSSVECALLCDDGCELGDSGRFSRSAGHGLAGKFGLRAFESQKAGFFVQCEKALQAFCDLPLGA